MSSAEFTRFLMLFKIIFILNKSHHNFDYDLNNLRIE